MMSKYFRGAFFAALLYPVVASAQIEDLSTASADGPYVFHRGNNIIVKSIVETESGVTTKIKTFPRKGDVLLTCRVAEQENFSFPLQAQLTPPPDSYAMPERLLVISDIEGNFTGFKTLLRGAGVIDEQFNWSYGDGHLLLLGDFFDRGLQVTECLWLIYKLEQEALAVGGRVHFILGNHEVMNLAGYTQYVRKKYFDNAKLLELDYNDLYTPQTELGRWLRTKNAVEKIGDDVFCHGGISPTLASYNRLSLTSINRIARNWYGVAVENITDGLAEAIFSTKTGIFWFRTAAQNLLKDEEVGKILQFAKANRMIIGHTLVTEVTGLYGNRVLCTDLLHEECLRQGLLRTLYFANGQPQILTQTGHCTPIVSVGPVADKRKR